MTFNKTYAHIIVELCEETTHAVITWYHGPYQREALDDLHDYLHSEGFYYSEMIEASFKVGEYVQLLVELVWANSETQYGTGEGDARVLPAYYNIKPLEVIDELRGGQEI